MEAKKLNQTFVPKDLLKKSILHNSQTLIGANNGDYEATTGNAFIRFEPAEVKFNGYELGKPQTIAVEILNQAPIPQRVHILPPTQPGFSIKTNKKGSIMTGMSENVFVTFSSDVHKYQYDVVKVNTETGNFVIPIYAYPSIPHLNQIFPKIIDFGSIPLNVSQSNIYPISNPVPLDFPYQFKYLEESSAFIISPFHGTIPASQTHNIEIAFIPSEKKTYVATVLLNIKQFDFQPIKIKLMGTGKDNKAITATKRISSSKLNPLKNSSQQKIVDEQTVELPTVNAKDHTVKEGKKNFLRSRTSYPKLLKKTVGQTQNVMGQQNEKTFADYKKEGQKQYLARYSRMQELDKEKQVKFCEYLGDKAMTEEELEFEMNVIEETRRTKLNNLEDICVSRHLNQQNNDGEVELATFVPRQMTWDINKNDQLKLRKQKLQAFMNAGSKIIQKYRLIKRLAKIKQFLSDCHTKEDVVKKVNDDFAKSLDVGKSGAQRINAKLSFSSNMMRPVSFPLQFKDENTINKIFQTDGKASFDDDRPLKEIQQHEVQTMNYQNLPFPSDFSHPQKSIPFYRRSGEEEYPLKTAALPKYEPISPSNVYKLPLKMPTHEFICNDLTFSRNKMATIADEKTADYLLNSMKDNVEDEFEGWSKGQMDVLKTKFLRNSGTQFTSQSLFASSLKFEFAFLNNVADHYPKQIPNHHFSLDDVIEQGDSDEQKLGELNIAVGQEVLQKMEQKNNKAKERRGKEKYEDFEGELREKCEKNLESIKLEMISSPIFKVSELNKWAEKRQNQILI